MASLVIPSAVQVRLHWTLNGVDCFNVLGGSVAGGFAASQAIANTIGAAILGRFTSSGLAALCATTTSLISVGLRDIRTANQPEFVSVVFFVMVRRPPSPTLFPYTTLFLYFGLF